MLRTSSNAAFFSCRITACCSRSVRMARTLSACAERLRKGRFKRQLGRVIGKAIVKELVLRSRKALLIRAGHSSARNRLENGSRHSADIHGNRVAVAVNNGYAAACYVCRTCDR